MRADIKGMLMTYDRWPKLQSSSYHKVQAPLVLHSFTDNATDVCVSWLQVCPS